MKNQRLSNLKSNLNEDTPLAIPEPLLTYSPQLINSYMDYANPLSDTPREFLLLPFLAMAGALISRKRYVEAGGTKILPIIWTVLFAGSSTFRKSTAIRIAKKPFKDVESYFQDKYVKELNNWKLKKKKAEEKDEKYDKEKPHRKTLFAPDGFSDVTFWESLRDNRSLVSVASEFTGLWTELNKTYNGLSDFALKLFDGEGGRRVTKSGGDIKLIEPIWCIVGATTIDNFRKTLTTTQRGSGFLQRIIPICIENNPKKFRTIFDNEYEDKELRKSISETLLKILTLNTKEMKLEQKAEDLYKSWATEIDQESKELEKKINDIGGYYSRLSIYAIKFALIFQVLDSPDKDVSEKNIKASLILCEWIKRHIIYMLEENYIFDQAYADRLKVRKLISKQPDNIITRTKLMNYSHFTARRLDMALNAEITSGNIGSKVTKTDGKNLTEYLLK